MMYEGYGGAYNVGISLIFVLWASIGGRDRGRDRCRG